MSYNLAQFCIRKDIVEDETTVATAAFLHRLGHDKVKV
jgi:hypothetical protein